MTGIAWFHIMDKNDSYSAMNSRGVHVLLSAFGIHFRFIGVSRVIGKIATTRDPAGSPLSLAANDFVNWWTAALAIPYPIIPGVPSKAALAPVNAKNPFSLRLCAARLPAITELHTLCFHMSSAFIKKSLLDAFPPAHPPATHIIPSSLSSLRISDTWLRIFISCAKNPDRKKDNYNLWIFEIFLCDTMGKRNLPAPSKCTRALLLRLHRPDHWFSYRLSQPTKNNFWIINWFLKFFDFVFVFFYSAAIFVYAMFGHWFLNLL